MCEPFERYTCGYSGKYLTHLKGYNDSNSSQVERSTMKFKKVSTTSLTIKRVTASTTTHERSSDFFESRKTLEYISSTKSYLNSSDNLLYYLLMLQKNSCDSFFAQYLFINFGIILFIFLYFVL